MAVLNKHNKFKNQKKKKENGKLNVLSIAASDIKFMPSQIKNLSPAKSCSLN